MEMADQEKTSRARTLRFTLSVATSFFTKGSGALIQLITLPIVMNNLGSERYSAYLTLTSFLAGISLLGFGAMPTLSRTLASIAATGNHRRESMLVSTALFVVGGTSICLSLGFLLLAIFSDVRWLLAASTIIPYSEITQTFVAAGAVAALLFFSNMAVAIRSAYQENYITNFWALSANFIVLCLVIFAISPRLSLTKMVLAIQLPMAIVNSIDIILIIFFRKHLRKIRLPDRETIKLLFTTSRTVWFVQLTFFMNMHFSLLITAHIATPADAIAYGSVLRLELFLSACIGMFLIPLLPAIANADAHNHVDWIRRAVVRITLFTLMTSIGIALALTFAGSWFVKFWLHTQIELPQLMSTALGIYFVMWMLQFTLFNVLLGLGETAGLVKIFILESTLIMVTGVILSFSLSATGMAIALAFGTSSVTAWILPLKTIRAIRKRENQKNRSLVQPIN